MDEPLHILLVEDEPAHAELVRRAFESGVNPTRLLVAGTLAEARSYQAAGSPPLALIIADWRLPDGEGMELLSADRGQLPIPVIIMTSHGNERVAVEAMRAGALDYVVKSETTLLDMPHIAERALREWHIVAERTRMENALRESERRFRTIFDSVNDAIFVHDLATGEILDVNRKMCEMYGYTYSDARRLNIEALSSGQTPYTQCDALQWMQKAASGESQLFEWHAKNKTGQLFWVEINMRRAFVGGHDRILVAARDISERKRAEQRERTITRGLRAVIEAADELMRCDDLDSVYRNAVELAREKIGLERCGLYLLDASQEYLVGVYGTDDRGDTTNEHVGRLSTRQHPEIFTPSDRPWLSFPSEHTYWDGDQHVSFGSGWVASTVIRNRDQPIGIFYNDAAISHLPLDDAIQETAAVYCSLLGNIIERKRTEEALRFSEDKFSKAFRTSPDAISITRLADGVYVEVNDGYTTLMGYTADEACGKSSLELNVWVDPHDRARMAEGVREQDEVIDLEVPFRHKSGRTWIGLMAARLIEVNGERCILSVTRDITARKQAEEAVRQSAERLSTLHEIDQAILLAKSSNDIAHAAVSRIQRLVPSRGVHVALFDGDEAIVTVAYCDGCRALTGEHIPWEALGLPESFKRGQVHVIDDLGRLATPSAAEQQMSADGARAYLKAPLIVMGELIGYLSLDSTAPCAFQTEQIEIAREVADQLAIAIQQTRLLERTQRHAAELERRVAERTRELAAANERLTELDRLKSKFVSDVSHELRTPIANLKLYADLLERGKPEKHEQYISVLRQQSKRLAQLVDDILNLSRLEMGKDRIAFGPVDLNYVVDQVVAAHQPRAEAASLTLTFEPHIDLPPVRGEVNQLAQVITNLIGNALNYTPHGCVRVATALLDDRVCLQVEDTGMGIDAVDLANIFDRFYRGRRPQKSDIPGTGLGLAIVKEIVDLHQGHIEVDSRVDHGTTFRVWLPLYV